MTRKKKLFLNTVSFLFHNIVGVICGFILPRYMIISYGSEVNGLVSSISQFMGFINIAECGIGAVIQSALYKPLAEKDDIEISKIIISAENFFKKFFIILFIYSCVLMFVYPTMMLDSFDFIYTMTLIAIIAFSAFVQNYLSRTYSLLITADSMGFIDAFFRTGGIILNTIISIILLKAGFGIHIVKFTSALIFLIRPLFLFAYVKKHYNLNKKLVLTEEPIKQKWNGLAQHIAAVISVNTDVILLTLFSTLQNVSIYSVYHLVVNGVRTIILSMTNGIQPLLGELYAKKEYENLKKEFSSIEWAMQMLVIFAYTCTGILLLPFISVYTQNITDANYIVPLFGVLITIANAISSIRLPYITMAYAAGHFRETQLSSIIEVILNLIVSIILIFKYGLVGVAIGTIVALSYRAIYFVWYLSKNILFRPMKYFYQYIFIDILIPCLTVYIVHFINFEVTNYFTWFLYALIVALITFGVIVIVNLIFYRNQIKNISKLKK